MFTYGRRAGYLSIALLVLGMVPLLAAALLVPQMADSVPMSFNSSGAVMRWGSRYEMLIAPVLCLLLAASMYLSAHRQARLAAKEAPTAARFTYTRFIRNGLVTVVVLNVVSGYLMFSALSGTGLAF